MAKIGKDCMKLIKRKISKEMTSDEYYLALMDLHKKYPLNCEPNFYSVAQMYAKRIPISTITAPDADLIKANERLPYKDE